MMLCGLTSIIMIELMLFYNNQGRADEVRGKYTLYADTNYDFIANRTLHKRTNVLEATAHLVKGCLGGGIMGIHEAYMKCGLWTSLGVTIGSGMYVCYCIFVLVTSAHVLYKRLHIPDMSYPDVAEASLAAGPFPKARKFSKLFRYAVDAAICVDLFGACCVYEIIIAKTILQVANAQTAEETCQADLWAVRWWLLSLLLPIVLLCMITSLKYLAPFSLLGNFFIVVCVIATIYYSLQVAPLIVERPPWKNILGLFEFCGIIIFSMESCGVEMGYSVVLCFVASVGFFGYWGFGEECFSPFTLNFPKDVFPTILKCMMALMIVMTFAVNFWAPFNLVWHYLKRRYKPEIYWLWERIYRAIFVTVITAVAITFPNISNLMGMLGAFCISFMGFIFPAMIETLVVWEDPGLGIMKWRLWKNIILFMIGVLLLVASSFANLKGLIRNM